MNNYLQNILETSIFCSIIILLVACLCKFTNKNYSSKWKYFIWLLLAIRMLLPFNFQLVEMPSLLPAAPTNMISSDSSARIDNLINTQDTITNIQNTNELSASSTVSQNTHKTTDSEHTSFLQNSENSPSMIPNADFNYVSFFTMLWIAGVIIFLFYHAFSYMIFLKTVKRWKKPVTQEEALLILSELLKELKLKKMIQLEINTYVSSPMLIGMISPTIILPTEDFSRAQMKLILKHELMHYKHHDLYFKFLLLCANAIHWFNPFAYYMVNAANHDMELVCDESIVLKQDEDFRRLYSFTILQTLTRHSADKCNALSTYFHGGKKQMKHRFSNIMSNSTKHSTLSLVSILLCLILLTGSLVACGSKSPVQKNLQSQSNTNTIPEVQNADIDKITTTCNILIAGLGGSPDNATTNPTDSIILVTLQPETNNITLTSFLRDMYVDIPGVGKDRICSAYISGGIDLLKKTLESNFDLSIDGTVTLNYMGFEKIIDQLGGVELSITEEEADYLNSTNYISDSSNRTIKNGTQNLNGNQAFGYMRIRHVDTSDGMQGDIGRTQRQRSLLLALYQKCKASNLITLLSTLNACLPYLTLDLPKEKIVTYIQSVFEADYAINTMQIPAKDTYQSRTIEGKSVLVPDISKNQQALKKITTP